jgi:hypothetical protein
MALLILVAQWNQDILLCRESLVRQRQVIVGGFSPVSRNALQATRCRITFLLAYG